MIKILKFSSKECTPCIAYASIFKSVSKDYKNIEFISYDADEHFEMFEKYKVRSVPVTILEVDNKEVKRKIGIMSIKDLKEFINETNK